MLGYRRCVAAMLGERLKPESPADSYDGNTYRVRRMVVDRLLLTLI